MLQATVDVTKGLKFDLVSEPHCRRGEGRERGGRKVEKGVGVE